MRFFCLPELSDMMKHFFSLLTVLFNMCAYAETPSTFVLQAHHQAIQSTSTIRAGDLSLINLVDLFTHLQTNQPPAQIIHETLRREVEQTSEIGSLFVTDQMGKVIYDSLSLPPQSNLVTDRLYFREAFKLNNNEIYIAQSHTDPVTRKKYIPLSRPIYGKDATVQYIAVAFLDATNLFNGKRQCDGCEIALYKSDNTKIYSEPDRFILDRTLEELTQDIKENTPSKLPNSAKEGTYLWLYLQSYDLFLVYREHQ